MVKRYLIGLAVFLLGIMACTGGDNLGEKRALRAEKSTGPIVIGAAAPWSEIKNGLWQGIELALSEINNEGGVLGRKIHVVKSDDEASVTKGQIVAQQFAEDLDMVAMIGHYNSYISYATSIIYEYYNLLMLSPTSTTPRLTERGFKRVFRNVPSDSVFGRELADFCDGQGYQNMVIYHSSDEYGQRLADAFEMEAEKKGIAIVDRIDYTSLSDRKNFQKDLAYWKDNFSFDAIFLGGITPQAGYIIKEARSLGINVPIIGGEGLDSPELFKSAGGSAINVFVGSAFYPDRKEKKVQHFVKAFSDRYKTIPDSKAAQGYDAMKLLAWAMEKAQSTVPSRIANALRATKGWEGATGTHTFAENGDIVEDEIFIKEVRNGRFEYYKSQ